MQIVRTAAEMRHRIQAARLDGKTIALVPTLGALHAGHVALMEAAREAAGLAVVSIYVNPAQFGVPEDLERYPRPFETDTAMARQCGIDILFAPDDTEMYPDGYKHQLVWVNPGQLGSVLEGEHRPGHFRGVATVVTKLFSILRPDVAFFGQKDAQQAVVVRRLVHDLSLGIDIRIVPTVREADGLALSSRNVHLGPEERRQAPAIFQALSAARQAFEQGERDSTTIVNVARKALSTGAPAARIEYVALSDAESLKPISAVSDRPALLSLAAFFGSTRLIDNVVLSTR